ncbi:hypothetical protein L1987_88013 [Smallanthus sonchifolius]|nr:hypothetical protein L1987_89288 [Smallanthus sonchifolius]KAI3666617.1 hypothetical protein L1987_88864 [Smallanthus sonchifolius]KAI3670277.1 hypothetical protein L1987_88013 [Smallanthus sonchifolius]
MARVRVLTGALRLIRWVGIRVINGFRDEAASHSSWVMRPRNCACVTVPVVGNGVERAELIEEGRTKKVSHFSGSGRREEHKAKATEAGYTEMAVFQLRNQLVFDSGHQVVFLISMLRDFPYQNQNSSLAATELPHSLPVGENHLLVVNQFRLKPLVELLSSASSVDFPVLVDSLNSSEGEGAASIALPVKTLGLGASVSSVHPRSAGQITTRAGSIESFSSAHVPTTTSAAILTSMEGYGGSPAAAPTPLPGALI